LYIYNNKVCLSTDYAFGDNHQDTSFARDDTTNQPLVVELIRAPIYDYINVNKNYMDFIIAITDEFKGIGINVCFKFLWVDSMDSAF
jgi:hypothetical protein